VPYPLTGQRWLVSGGSGEEPVWRTDRKEIVFQKGTWRSEFLLIDSLIMTKDYQKLLQLLDCGVIILGVAVYLDQVPHDRLDGVWRELVPAECPSNHGRVHLPLLA
jgi:hypothetical protein